MVNGEFSDRCAAAPAQSGGTANDAPPRDLPRWLTWYVLPLLGLGVILLLFLELGLGEDAMRSGMYPNRDGVTLTWYQLLTFKEGPVEYSAVLIMLPGIFAGLYAAARYKLFPDRRLGILALVFALGLTYFAGEELSWGHHIAVSFGWKQPQPVTVTRLGVNEQGETNIHNLDTWYGKLLGRGTKNIIEVWCYGAALVMPLLLARRKPPLTAKDTGYWFWPTTATVVCAALVFLTYRPVRLYIRFNPQPEGASEPYWARQSELQEFFMAAVLSIYICSIAWRLRQMPEPQPR